MKKEKKKSEQDAEARKRAENGEYYRSLFEDSPISLWEEDFSDIKGLIENLRGAGVNDFRAYFEEHPEEVAKCAAMVKVVNVNRATLELYQAGSEEEFRHGLNVVFGEESYDVFKEELVAIAEGKTRFESDTVTRTLKGHKNHISLRWSVMPGFEKTLSKVFVSVIDITERKQAEEALQESEERHRNLFESSPIGIYRTTPDGRILMANPALLRMLGYASFQDLAARDLEKEGFEPTYPRSQFKERMEAEGEVTGLEAAWAKSDGSIISVRENAKAIRDEKGAIRYYEGTVEDISERKRVEKELRLSERKFRSYIENAPDGVLVVDREGKFLEANDAACRIGGYSKKELLEKSIPEMLAPESKEAGAKHFRQVVAEGRASGELAYIRKDGTKGYWSVDAVKIAENRFLGFVRDTTERKNAEKAAAYERDLMQTLLNNIPDYIYFKDRNRRFVRASDSFGDLFGCDPKDIIGKTDEDLFPEEVAEKTISDDRHVIETGIPLINKEEGGKSIGGEEHWVLTTKLPWCDKEGNIIGLFGVSRDITERKRAEEQLRKSEEKYRNMIELAPDGILIVNLKGIITACNSAFLSLSGYSRDEIVNKHVIKLPTVRARDIPKHMKTLASFMAGQVPDPFEIEWIHKNGSRRSAEIRVSPAKEGSRVIGFQAVARDTTERKQAEEALRESEGRLREAQRIGALGDWQFDVEGQQITWSDETHRLFERDPASGPPTLEENMAYYHPEDSKKLQEQVRRAIEFGEEFDTDYRLKLPSGKSVYHRGIIKVQKDESGKVTGLYGTVQDITERKRAEERLQVSHDFLEISNQHREMTPLLKEYIAEVKKFTGCTAVGVRILCKEGWVPYLAYEGFSRQFYELESPLSIKSDQCMCVNVIKGVTDPKLPFFTEGGSFYMGGTTRFLATVSAEEKGETRNICNEFGYESVALVPIRVGKHVLGLIHVADPRQNMVPLEMVEALEHVAAQLGTGIERVRAEEALAESEQRFRTVFESAPIGMDIVDVEGRPMRANRALQSMLGYTEDELRKKRFEDYTHSEDVEASLQLMKRLLDGKDDSLSTENRYIRKDGSVIWAHTSVFAVRDAEGNFQYFVAMVEDITERKQAEEKLRGSEERYKALFDRSLESVYIHDFEGNFLDANPTALSLLGYKKEEIESLNFGSLLSKDQIPQALQVAEQLKERGFQEGLTEYRLKRKDGQYVDVETKASVIYREGKPFAIQGIARDITERKRAEEALRESEERHRTLLESSPDSIYVLDREWRHVLVNKAATEFVQMPAEKLLGNRLTDLFPGIEKTPFFKTFKEVMDTGKQRTVVNDYLFEDGRKGYYEVKVTPVPEGILCISRDVTERKRAEDALRESEKRLKEAQRVGALGDWQYDVETEQITWSDETYRLFERDPASGPPTLEENMAYYHPEDSKKLQEQVRRAIEFGEEFDTDYRLKLPNGKSVYHRGIIKVQKDESGKVTGLYGTVQDITERKHAEEALGESEERFRIASQIASDVVYERDLKTGIATFYGDIDGPLGYEPGGYPHTMEGWRNHVHPEDLAWIDSQNIDQLEPGVPHSIEYRMRKKDGTYMTWLDRILIIRDKKTGKPLKFIGAATDITERKRAEEALRSSEQRYRLLFERNRAAVYQTTLDGRFVDCNEAFARLLGFDSREEVLRHSASEFYFEASHRVEFLSRLHEKGSLADFEMQLKRKDGESVWILENVILIKGDGSEPALIQGTSIDVTERKKAERKIRMLSASIDDAYDGIALTEMNGDIVYANKAASKIFGYSHAEIMKLNIAVFSPDQEEAKKLEEGVRKEGRWSGEIWGVRKNKEKFPALLSVSVIKDEKGTPIVRIGAFKDITERRRAEEALLKSEEKYRTLVETAQEGIGITDPDENLTFVNQAFADLLGYTKEELLSLNLSQICDEEQFAKLRKESKKRQRGQSSRYEARLYAKTGEVRYFDVSATPLVEEKGAVTASLAFLNDITERKRAEEALRESEEKYRRLFELGSDALFLIEVETGRVLDLNDTALKVYGYSREEALQMKNTDFSAEPPQTRQATVEHEQQIPVRYHKKKDGTIFPTDISVAYFTWYGREVCIAAIRNITERKRGEEALRESEKLAATGCMAARIAHEINNPLGGIKNSFLLIKDAIPEDHTYYEYVGRIEKEIDRIARIVRQMFHLYRQDKEPTKQFPVDETIRDVVALLESSCRQRQVKIEFDTGGAPIVADAISEGSLRQVLFNIIHNAIETSPPGKRVKVTAGASKNFFTLTVSDQGKGIPEEIRSRIFEPFFTTKSAEVTGGLGLGLSVSKSLVEGMGGSLDFESKTGKGTIFNIVLPIRGSRKEKENA